MPHGACGCTAADNNVNNNDNNDNNDNNVNNNNNDNDNDNAGVGRQRGAAAAMSGGAIRPVGVRNPVTNRAGVTSNPQFLARVEGGPTGPPFTISTSSSPRSSIGIDAPSGQPGSNVDHGSAT